MNSAPVRRVVLFVSLCYIALLAPLSARAQQDEGEKIFKQVCFVCHTINQGKLIGPDLAGVQTRRPLDWIIGFVRSSQSVIGSGDTYAVELFEKHNKIPMPDNNLSDAQITSIIDYIAAVTATGEGVGLAQAAASLRPATEEEIRAGEALFVGARRLAGGGPICISCHNVKYDGVLAGGTLARDLTDANSRLGGPGMIAIIGNAPFPAMKQAFADKPITEDEAFMLAAFLQRVDSVRDTQHMRHYGARLFFSGLGGAFLMIGLLSGAWFRVKKRSVNHAIYRRQVKSTWEPRNDSGRGGPR